MIHYILFQTRPDKTILYYTILYYNILYYTMLYYAVLYVRLAGLGGSGPLEAQLPAAAALQYIS